MWGRQIAAHAHGAEGIIRAVRAGAWSIEHGSLLDDEAIDLMKQRATWLVPTIFLVGYVETAYASLGPWR
jgi:imidazolonepropionase-like amidohydrolase